MTSKGTRYSEEQTIRILKEVESGTAVAEVSRKCGIDQQTINRWWSQYAVETLCLQTLYVLFFIELASRRVDLAGCAARPENAWVTQQARQIVWQLDETKTPMRFPIHDRERKFTTIFDHVFASQGIEIVRTPFRAPRANTIAERWVRSIRQECLDHHLILNQRHLIRVLREYSDYYNVSRPHQGVIRCRDVQGGIPHDYDRDAA